MKILQWALGLLGISLFLQLAGCASSPRHYNLADQRVTSPTPLMKASIRGDLAQVRALVARGAAVNAVGPRGPALKLAVAHQRDKVALRLLADGAKPDLTGPDGVTALMLASRNGDEELVKRLLARGADVNHQAADGSNAVAYAAGEGNLAVIRRLLAAGGNVNIVIRGESLLMRVVNADNLLMTNVLISAGADVNYRAADGRTALAIARSHHNRDIQMLLLQAGAQSS